MSSDKFEHILDGVALEIFRSIVVKYGNKCPKCRRGHLNLSKQHNTLEWKHECGQSIYCTYPKEVKS